MLDETIVEGQEQACLRLVEVPVTMEDTVFSAIDYDAVEAFCDVACLLFTCLSWEVASLDTGAEYVCISQGPDCPGGEACYTCESAPVTLPGVVLDTWVVVAHHRGGHIMAGGATPAVALGNARGVFVHGLSVASRMAAGALPGRVGALLASA